MGSLMKKTIICPLMLILILLPNGHMAAKSDELTQLTLAYASVTPLPYVNDNKNLPPLGVYYAISCEAENRCQAQLETLVARKAKIHTKDEVYSGLKIHTTQVHNPLFLIRGLPALAVGGVKTWHYNPKFQKNVEYAAIAFDRAHGKPHQRWHKINDIEGESLAIRGTWIPHIDPLCFGCGEQRAMQWRFTFKQITRTLAIIPEDTVMNREGMLDVDALIVWVGDLDLDGLPDMVLRPQARADYLTLHLYLSRDLKPQQPWKQAARFYFWDPANPGC